MKTYQLLIFCLWATGTAAMLYSDLKEKDESQRMFAMCATALFKFIVLMVLARAGAFSLLFPSL